jgi:hypothetical protein
VTRPKEILADWSFRGMAQCRGLIQAGAIRMALTNKPSQRECRISNMMKIPFIPLRARETSFQQRIIAKILEN